MKNHTTTRKHPSMALTIGMVLATSAFSPLYASSKDLDSDGISNKVDSDVDGDGIPNGLDDNVDGGICKRGPHKGQFVGDHLKNGSKLEKDIDGDGLTDDSALEKDIDGDSKKDSLDDDIDGDGKKNGVDDDCDGDDKLRDMDDDDDGDELDDKEDSDDDNDGLTDEEESEITINLTAAPDAPDGSRMEVDTTLNANGKIELKYTGRDLAAGSYDIVIGDQIVGQIEMIAGKGRIEGETRFDQVPNKPNELPLPFNPVGLATQIVQGSTIYFTGTVPTPSDVFVHN